MSKLLTLDCKQSPAHKALLVAIALLALVLSTSAIKFTSPKDLMEVVNDELVPYTIKEADFEIAETEVRPGAWKYRLTLKASKPTILVVKNDLKNKAKKKLENYDGMLFISPTVKHLYYASRELDAKIQYNNLTSFIENVRKVDQNCLKNLRLPLYQHEKWPASVLVDQLTNNKKVLHGLYRKLFLNEDNAGESYVKIPPIVHLQPQSIIETYKNFIVLNMNNLIETYILKYLKPRRDILRAAKTCTWGHASIETITTYIKTKSTPILEGFVDSSVRIIFTKFYQDNYLPLFDDKGVETFIKTTEQDDLNLLINATVTQFPSGIQGNFNLGVDQQTTPWIGLGQQIIFYLKNRYREYTNKKLVAAYKEAEKNPYIASFLDLIDDQIRDLLEKLNVEFKTYYSVEFEENEKLEFEKDALKLIDVKDFFTNQMIGEVSHVLQAFVQNYLWYTTNLTLMPNLMFELIGNVQIDRGFQLAFVNNNSFNTLAPIVKSDYMNYPYLREVDIFNDERRLQI